MKIDTEILCSFIDGELDDQAAQTVRAALETDQKLRCEYEGLCKTAQLVRSLPRVSAPPELAAAITAHTERSQLLGPTEPGQSRPSSRFRWTLSMAASLLVGASLGILGYHAWPGRVAPSRPPSESVITAAADDYEPKDSPEMLLAPKTAPSGKLSLGYTADAGEPSERASGEIAAGLPRRPTETPYAAKGGPRIARSGPAKGPPAKSRGATYIDRTAMAEKRSVENERIREETAFAPMTPAKEAAQAEQGARDALAFAGDVPRSRAKAGETSDEAFRAGITMQKALAGRENIPLEYQVLSNNYINQRMAENLKFEAEPLNVKVVSNDSAKTLQFVRQWAMGNSLIDLNKAPAKLNFPAYTHVVFQGQAGTNTNVDIKNSIFVRTTRRQAQDIVGQLQRQKPTVLSVSVKDEKNLLAPLAVQASQWQAEALYLRRQFADQQQEEDAGKKADLELKSELAESAHRRGLRTPANGYLYDLSNQAQVISLEDLVTLVVLVEDAPLAVKTKAAPPATPQPTESPLPEGNTESK